MESHTRFIVGNNLSLNDVRDLSDSIYTIDLIKNKSILVIADISYYIQNESEITKWCNSSLTRWSQTGMILGFVNDEERNLFLIRWS